MPETEWYEDGDGRILRVKHGYQQILEIKVGLRPRAVVLLLSYDELLFLKTQAEKWLRQALVEAYQVGQSLRQDPPASCIVDIDSAVVGSALVRALFQLWKQVTANPQGQLICARYPQRYRDLLLTLGLPQLKRFGLATNEQEALERLERRAG
jgi:hypothetical protein